MKMWVRITIFAAVAAVMVPAAAAETRLAGIRLYDSGVDVVRKLGSPTDVLPVVFDTAAGGGGGGGSRGGGGGGSRGGGGFAPAPAGGGNANFVVPPVSFNQMGKGGGGQGPAPMGGPGSGPAPMGGGRGGGGGGVTDTQYVRWVYKRGAGGSVNVVLNKFNKVVQIEAIGISNPKVKTSKGVMLGSSLATIIRKYQNPDAYEVGDNYFMVRFLQSHKVAFRLTRENNRAPYRVTGIVVSAGKS